MIILLRVLASMIGALILQSLALVLSVNTVLFMYGNHLAWGDGTVSRSARCTYVRT